MTAKLLAEWFWTDRWMGSSGFLLPMEARGLYREMLTQAWRRGGTLPNNHEAIQRAVGCTSAEWERCWPKVKRFWIVTEDGETIFNETQREIYGDAWGRHMARVNAGRKGGKLSRKSRNNPAESKQNVSKTEAMLKQRGKQNVSKTEAMLKQRGKQNVSKGVSKTEAKRKQPSPSLSLSLSLSPEPSPPKEETLSSPVAPLPSTREAKPSPKVRIAQIREVFEHFHAGSPRSKLTDSRKKLIQGCLVSYSVDDLKLAIDGLWLSKWHVDNGRQTIEYALRNADKIEGLQAVASDPHHSDRIGPVLSPDSREAVRAAESFVRRHQNGKC